MIIRPSNIITALIIYSMEAVMTGIPGTTVNSITGSGWGQSLYKGCRWSLKGEING